MINEAGIRNLRERYFNINPLMFQRCVSLSNSLGELFDMLEDVPNKYPLIWCRVKRKWVVLEDIITFKAEDLEKQ